MWKKLVSLNLALLLLLALLPVPASAASNFFTDYGSRDLFALAHWNSGLAGDTLFFPKACFLSSGPDLMLYETASTFERDGYVVTSYNSKADGSGWSYPLTLKAKYSFSRKKDDPAHLYAQWAKVTGLSLLYVGDGVGAVDGRDYKLQDGFTRGQTVRLAEADLFPSEGSRKIIGWREVGEPHREFLPGQTITLDSSMTLTPILGTNYITYHYGGISETVFYEMTPEGSWMDIAHDPVGSSEIVQKVYESCKEKNQFFTGWKTADGRRYRDYVKDAPHDLYAVTGNFPDTDYCVLYSKFGFPDGSLYQSRTLDSDGTAPALPSSLEAPEGYNDPRNFMGWYDTDDFFADNAAKVDDTTPLESRTVIYARWGGYTPPASEIFTVAFHPLNGSGIKYVHSDSARKVIPPGNPVKAGYTFLGWAEQDGSYIVDFNYVYINKDKTFYARWERNNEAIPGNNDPPEGSSLITFHDTYLSPKYCFAYTGADGVLADAAWPPDPILRSTDPSITYTFQGWCVRTPYIPGGPEQVEIPVSRGCVFSGDTDVHAMWLTTGQDPDPPGPDNPRRSTIKFNLNYPDAPAPPPDQTTDDYGRLTSLPVPAARSGYTFQGWFTDQNGGLKATTSTTFPKNTTLYAHWTPDGTTPPGPDEPDEPKAYTVTFNPNGGVGGAVLTTGTDGRLAALPASPVRPGYTFDGWFTRQTGGTAVTTATVFTENAAVYAHWTQNGGTTDPDNPDRFTVTFDPNGGTGGAVLTTGADGRLAALPASPVRPGYTFDGWFTRQTGGTAVTTATVFTENAAVYAHWTAAAGLYYRIYTPDRTPGGSLYVSHTLALAGTRVTLEPAPRRGYELDWLSVTDLDTGREIRLREYGTDEYVFTMPAADVEVEVAFFLRNTGGSSGSGSGGSFGGSTPAPVPAPAGRTPVRWYYSGGAIYHVVDGRVPDGTWLTRDMLISVLYNLDDTSSGEPEFWATSRQVIPDIYKSWLWGADRAISREQAAAILFSYAQYKNYNNFERADLSGYTDQDLILPIARPAVSWARATGLIAGTTARTLSPKGRLTARQGGVIVARFLGDAGV